MSSDMEQYVSQYKTSEHMTPRARAELEERIWRACPDSMRRELPKGLAVGRLVGVGAFEVRVRSFLLNAGSLAEPIWDRITNQSMAPTTGANLIRQAKRSAVAKGVSREAALAQLLTEYEAKPVWHSKAGTVFRRRVGGGRRALTERPAARKTQPTGWRDVEERAKQLVQDRLIGEDPLVVDSIWQSFQTDLRVLVKDVQDKVARRLSRKKEKITRRAIMAACETLHMDPPQADAPIDLDEARRQKRKLAKLYHPDSNGGNAATAGLLQASLAAFDTLERYEQERATR